MRIVKLTYAMLRVTNQYENDRVQRGTTDE